MSNTKRIYKSEASSIGSVRLKVSDRKKAPIKKTQSTLKQDKKFITPDLIYRLIERIKEL
jgi:hypothetical protein